MYVRIAFEKLEKFSIYKTRKRKNRPGYEQIDVHMIYDTNMYGKFTKNQYL